LLLLKMDCPFSNIRQHGSNRPRSVAAAREKIRDALPERPYAGILIALAIGDQNAIDPRQWPRRASWRLSSVRVEGVKNVNRPPSTVCNHVSPSFADCRAAPKSQCPVCNNEAVRVFHAPMHSFASRALVAAIDRTEKTSDEPEVVSALPPRSARTRRPMAARNPALQRLPRP